MTIAQSARGGILDDAGLARAAVGGDQSAFAAIYDRYADRLYDFCVGMLRDRDAAADCVQDVFVTAATRLAQLREPDRLKSWLYAIARNEALSRIRDRRREEVSEDLPEPESGEPDAATFAARHELADLISAACDGLSDRDRAVYELAYRRGLDGFELAEALGVSHTNANTLVLRLRESVERSLGALLVCRHTKADANGCPQLAAQLQGWDGKLTVLMRKRVARHIEGCAVCDGQRRRMVNPVALLGSVPVFLPAPLWLRDITLNQVSGVLPPAATGAPISHASHAGAGHNASAAGSAHSTTAQGSWWPPSNFDTSDLGSAGLAPTGHSGTPTHAGNPHHFGTPADGAPASGPSAPATSTPGPSAPQPFAPKSYGVPTPSPAPNPGIGLDPASPTLASPGSSQVPHGNLTPPTTVTPMNIDSGTGRLGGHIRRALLVLVLLLVLAGSFLLGPRLVYRIWPASAPGTSAPVTTAPSGSSPTSRVVPVPASTPPSRATTTVTTTPSGPASTGDQPPAPAVLSGGNNAPAPTITTNEVPVTQQWVPTTTTPPVTTVTPPTTTQQSGLCGIGTHIPCGSGGGTGSTGTGTGSTGTGTGSTGTGTGSTGTGTGGGNPNFGRPVLNPAAGGSTGGVNGIK
jgi:RNA polymerase sigma factor (sigma-70 family)